MKKNIVFNKYYRRLRRDVFPDLPLNEFMEVYANFKRLRIQYKLLKIANFLERRNIPKVEVLILKFLFKLLDFIRWKLYDLLMLLINGRQFNLFGVTIFCGRQGSGKTIGIVEELERIREAYPKYTL